MRKKLLVLFGGDIFNRRGFFNAVISRTKYLKDICDYDIDCLLLSTYEPWLIRKLRHTTKKAKPISAEIDGLILNIRWKRFSLIDYILSVKFHKRAIFKPIYYYKIAKDFQKYDLIIAHSHDCGIIAMHAKALYGIPYTVTWHGSDIHTEPFNNMSSRQGTIKVIENANMNFFVSKDLMQTSNTLTDKGNKMVLYNGKSIKFRQYPDKDRLKLKQNYNVENKKVVVFAGNFVVVKNILKIPLIFKAIYAKYSNVIFWMIGDGKFRDQVEKLSEGLPIYFWGNQEPELMPDFLNASDVLILPSINEGLPLTVIEGLACGCNVVGSLVGGIPEVIGKENCIDLRDRDFVNKFADKVLSFLTAKKHINQVFNSDFDWNKTAAKELDIINKILYKK